MDGATMSKTILRRREVERRTGKCRSSIYADIDEGKFPKPVPIGNRAVGWVESEIDGWIEARIAVRDNAAAA
jgi:prophage regulatory protein